MKEYMAIASTYEMLVEITKDIDYKDGTLALVYGEEYIYNQGKWEKLENNNENIE